MASGKGPGVPSGYLLGLFEDERAAVRAIDGIQGLGIARDRVKVMSSVPYPEGTFGTDDKPSRLPFFSVFGGFGGLLAGLGLAAGTALLYPLPTGGKPIVAWPTVGVIAYEMTMLGIILLTLLGVLYEMRLPRVKKSPYDPRINDGYVGVLVPCEAGQRTGEAEETLEKILKGAGAAEVKRHSGG